MPGQHQTRNKQPTSNPYLHVATKTPADTVAQRMEELTLQPPPKRVRFDGCVDAGRANTEMAAMASIAEPRRRKTPVASAEAANGLLTPEIRRIREIRVSSVLERSSVEPALPERLVRRALEQAAGSVATALVPYKPPRDFLKSIVEDQHEASAANSDDEDKGSMTTQCEQELEEDMMLD